MKFLLTAINAKYIHSNPAVYSIRSFAGTEVGTHMDIAEYTINQQTGEILADIYQKEPDVIAFSCYIWNWEMICKLLPELHKLLPGVPVWLGGPEVSYDQEAIMNRFPSLAGIMAGEGEETCTELAAFYLSGHLNAQGDQDGQDGEPSDIKGILYRRKSGELCQTPDRELIDLNRIPFPYPDLSRFQNRIIYYESSRGCPFRCSYCLSSIDKKLRLKHQDKVKAELLIFLARRVPQVKFVDRTFNCDHSHALAIWQFIREHDNGITNFHFEIAADILTDRELTLLSGMRPGLLQLEVGVQSTHPPTLKSICRPMDFSRLQKNVALLKQSRNIHLHLDLIAGLPFENYEQFADSFNAVYACRPEQIQLGFLKVLSGTSLRHRAQEYGIQYTTHPPYQVLFTGWLSYLQLERLKKVEEMVELYYNSSQFTNTLAALETAFETPFQMYECLAAYYEEKGCFLNHPARSYRYQILLDFACSCDRQHEECYRELLTYDLYLRENIKSRPGYAPDRSPHYDWIRRFYRQEEQMRNYLPHYTGYQARQLERMTHIEAFYYPVYQSEGKDKMKKQAQPEYILFDYQEKDPLTGAAKTHRRQGSIPDNSPGNKDTRLPDEGRVRSILKLLNDQYGTDYRCFLNHENAWQLLIATILSAQCTDARVNIVTDTLFKKYPSPAALAAADPAELEQDIHSTGFYRNKAKNIIACCQTLMDKYGGEVPAGLPELTALPGVGRKTANVIRGNIFHDPSIVVDTHVKRISKKLGLTTEEDPVKIELQLMKILPRDHWILYNIQIITLGRTICKAPTPNCPDCFLKAHCPDFAARTAPDGRQ